MPSFGVHAVSVDKADKVHMDPVTLRLACEHGEGFAFDPDDVANMRIWTVDMLLSKLVEQVLRTTKVKGKWPEQHVTIAIFSAMSTGNWRGTSMSGVTQLANRANRTSLRSQMSDVVSVYTAMQARFVHPSTHGFFCVSQTPEGQKVGLVHQLVEGVEISDESTAPPVPTRGRLHWFHNGERQVHKTGKIEGGTLHAGCMWTWSDAGRLIKRGGMLGRTARHIPFLEHNQGPRISYYCSMAKQAMGDTGKHTLLYAQRPLVTPCHEATEGCNVILAVNCMGYNQEDALVASKGALERGLFRSIQWNTYSANVDEVPHLAVGHIYGQARRAADHHCGGIRVPWYVPCDHGGAAHAGARGQAGKPARAEGRDRRGGPGRGHAIHRGGHPPGPGDQRARVPVAHDGGPDHGDGGRQAGWGGRLALRVAYGGGAAPQGRLGP
jgi:hypothetical protein